MQSSDPQNGEVVNEQLDQITLTFEGNIEQASCLHFLTQMANLYRLPTSLLMEMF
ncbi:copper resistance protein CopC [Ureibacillus acetophenoni]